MLPQFHRSRLAQGLDGVGAAIQALAVGGAVVGVGSSALAHVHGAQLGGRGGQQQRECQ